MTAGVDSKPDEQWLFGPFRLLQSQRLLLEGSVQVPIGTRAFDLLVLLASRAGEVVSQAEIIENVWHGLSVDVGSVRVHVARMRRALRDGKAGARYVVNLPGRGYMFVAPVSRVAPSRLTTAVAAPRPQRPHSPRQVFGRANVIDRVCFLLKHQRLVTLVGAGGVGKTTVAIAVADRLAAGDRDGNCFVDFSLHSHGNLVAERIASALGLPTPPDDAMPAILDHLRRRRLLLVLDNCEHLVEAVAATAEQIVACAPRVCILATSREPLRATGERVHRLEPLECPPAALALTAQQMLDFPSVQLFVARYAAAGGDVQISDAQAVLVVEMCRRLDGIALAIELAAARAAAFGLEELATRLDDRFTLLIGGRRTARPQHQTLSAALEWSYTRLSTAEQTLWRRASIFPAKFSLEDAAAVMTDVEQTEIAELVAALVMKSVITADRGNPRVRYRLLETMRLFGAEKSRSRGELDAVARLHARHVLNVLLAAEAELALLRDRPWRAKYAGIIEDARAAQDWSHEHDADLSVQLTIAAVPLWVQLSLMEECRHRVQRALAMVAGQDQRAARMRLLAALGWSLIDTEGRSDAIGPTWKAALELAEEIGDLDHQRRAIWGMWVGQVCHGELAVALVLASRLLDLAAASQNDADLMAADWIMAVTLHFRGDQHQAKAFMDRMFARYEVAPSPPNIAPFHVDQKVKAKSFHARILWLQGSVDQAWDVALECLREAEALGHASSFADVLGHAACPIALLRGDTEAARRYGTMLLECAECHGLRLWSGWARCFGGLVSIREGNVDSGLETMRVALDGAGDRQLLPRYMLLIGEYAACAGLAGSASTGIEMIDAVLARCKRTEERWYEPDLRRIRGELMARSEQAASIKDVEAEFLQAIDLSARQGAKSWQLRAALGLARFRRDTGASAAEPLATIVESFAEGFSTTDLLHASQLLSSLEPTTCCSG